MKVHPETVYQTVRIFDEQPVKAKSKPTVKAHTDASPGRDGNQTVLVALKSFRADRGH